jgi:uncharacterized membrane protein YjjP (DUF1212 family)
MRPNQPGYYLALTFFLCVISVIFFPRIFAGSLEVFSIARVDGQVGIVSKPLRPTNGNITQLFRFFLAVLTFFAMATLAREGNSARPVVIALIVATLMHALLGALDELLDPGQS